MFNRNVQGPRALRARSFVGACINRRNKEAFCRSRFAILLLNFSVEAKQDEANGLWTPDEENIFQSDIKHKA